MKVVVIALLLNVLGCLLGSNIYVSASSDCVLDWAKCGGKDWTNSTTCCNSRFYCLYSNEYYSECVPKPVTPMPPAPPSKWCGQNGTNIDSGLLKYPGNITPREIAHVWVSATQGLDDGRHKGGMPTCIQAVSIALGECGHPAQSPWRTIDDPVCNFGASGNGGIWQITSQDTDDGILAGCTNGHDCCCNARIAWAHAYNQGGATVLPAGYCKAKKDCTQIYSNCGGTSGPKWNDVSVDLKYKYDGAPIPDCNYNCNPWYPNCGRGLIATATIDQEPCYWGPFTVAAGGVGKEFFPGFYGWGGYFQHYVDSKAGACDDSPQCQSERNSNCTSNPTYASYPTYYELAQQACGALFADEF